MAASDQTTQSQTNDPNRVFRTIAGERLLFDREGFLWNPEDWSEEVAKELAQENGPHAMNETHWRVIKFLREYYFEQGRAPLNAQLRKGTGMSLMELERLFPGGIKGGARRIAGLPNPKSCTG